MASKKSTNTTHHTSAEQARADAAKKLAPAMSPVEMLRWMWTQLTSMRTALVLLFLLALTAIPGGLIPQQSVSPIRVSDFAKNHPNLDKIYRPLGMYHVYTSPWFSAVYLLLFVSLIGCIIPRIGVYWRAVRTPPPKMPARLDRLPEAGVVPLAATDDQNSVIESAQAWLKKARYRTIRRDADSSADSGALGISAERGYLREFGNLLFHISAVFVLVGVAISNLYGFKGTSTVVVGEGFSNTITQYDELHAGALVDTNKLSPFTVLLKSFTATFETGPVQTGAARSFDAVVDVTADGKTKTEHLQVNHPLNIDGTLVHILAHGYAARVTVRDGQGHVAYSGPVVFQPTDGNFSSLGVIKVPDARPERLGFQGFFLPTAVVDPHLGPHSIFPDALNPQLFLNAWYAKPATETGIPESIFTLNTVGMTQVKKGNEIVRINLKPGESFTLPNNLGSISFDGYSRWTKLQISRNPGMWFTVGSIGASVVGLCLSLFVRPRRLWIRLRRNPDGTIVAEAGGLDRADARTGLADDVRGLLAAATHQPLADITVRSREWSKTGSPGGGSTADAGPPDTLIPDALTPAATTDESADSPADHGPTEQEQS